MTGRAPSCMLLKSLGKWLCAAFLKVGGLTLRPGSFFFLEVQHKLLWLETCESVSFISDYTGKPSEDSVSTSRFKGFSKELQVKLDNNSGGWNSICFP